MDKVRVYVCLTLLSDESLPLIDNHNDASLHSVLIGIRPYVFQWLLVVLIAIVHPLLALYLPVPGCPTGYLGTRALSLRACVNLKQLFIM